MTKTRPRLGVELEEAANELLAHLRNDEVDVRRLRQQTDMSQVEFARTFYFNPKALQQWEQGRSQPDLTARADHQQEVLDALAS